MLHEQEHFFCKHFSYPNCSNKPQAILRSKSFMVISLRIIFGTGPGVFVFIPTYGITEFWSKTPPNILRNHFCSIYYESIAWLY